MAREQFNLWPIIPESRKSIVIACFIESYSRVPVIGVERVREGGAEVTTSNTASYVWILVAPPAESIRSRCLKSIGFSFDSSFAARFGAN